tara:strand:- start:2573 stop:3106 length:534 start_codon:yes stop_codon:yes gene_type:complete
MKKHIVFDRDGTLIKHIHYLSDPDKVVLMPGVKDLINKLLDLDYNLYLHTNQSGIGRGYFGIDKAISCNNKMEELISAKKKIFKEICIASEKPDNIIEYRKPSIKFGEFLIRKYDIDRASLFYVGDNNCDIETSIGLKCNGIGILNDRNIFFDRLKLENNIKFFNDIKEAIYYIIKK